MELATSAASLPWLAAVVAGAALFLVTILRLRPRPTRKYRLPPGPRQWPVIGNLNLIGPLPHHSIHELSKRYGPLMSLRFGSFPVVVASSVDTARLFLRTHDLAFIDRPQTAAGKYTSYNYAGLFYQPYGAYLRQGRRLCQAELFNARRLMSLEHDRSEEVRAMLSDLHAVSSSSAASSAAAAAAAGSSSGGNVVALREHLYMVNLNVISRMFLGKKYIVDGSGSPVTPEEFRWLMDEHFFLNGVINVADMIPWLSCIDPQGYIKRMKRLAKMFDRLLEHVLDEHNERRRREGKDFVAMDMVDVLLELADDPNLEVPMDRNNVKGFTLKLRDRRWGRRHGALCSRSRGGASSSLWAALHLLGRNRRGRQMGPNSEPKRTAISFYLFSSVKQLLSVVAGVSRPPSISHRLVPWKRVSDDTARDTLASPAAAAKEALPCSLVTPAPRRLLLFLTANRHLLLA